MKQSPIRKLHQFLQLSWPDRWLLIHAGWWLGLITLGLRVMRLQTLQRLLLKRATRRASNVPAQRLAWAVRAASRFVPAATCLPQTLAAQVLFIQHGYPAELQIGAAKRPNGTLEAHAWLTSNGEIVLGALPDMERFVPLGSVQRGREQEQTG